MDFFAAAATRLLAKALQIAYPVVMQTMKHWNIGAAFGDLWAYLRVPHPQRWLAWGVALATGWLAYWGMSALIVRPVVPKAAVVYVENWGPERSQAEILADRIERAKAMTRANAQRRAQYQRVADAMGISYDSAEADAATVDILGAQEAAALRAPPPPPAKSTLAERAARAPTSAERAARAPTSAERAARAAKPVE